MIGRLFDCIWAFLCAVLLRLAVLAIVLLALWYAYAHFVD